MTSGNRNPRRRWEPRASCDTPQSSLEHSQGSLALTVIFTTTVGTLQALRHAARFAQELGASIRILVPHIVPYPLPLSKPQVDPEFGLRHFLTCSEQARIETRIDIRLCRDTQQCIHAILPANSVVLIQARHSYWPWTYEKCLAKALKRSGHQVLVV